MKRKRTLTVRLPPEQAGYINELAALAELPAAEVATVLLCVAILNARERIKKGRPVEAWGKTGRVRGVTMER